MKVVKWILVCLLAAVFLSMTAIFLLLTFYKKELSAKLIDELNLRYGVVLKVNEVRVSFIDNWPHASVDFQEVSIRSALAPTSSPDLIHAKSLAFAFDLRQLRKGQVVVRHIALHDAVIALERDRRGDANFIFKKNDTIAVEHSSADGEEDGEQAIRFEVRKINLKNCAFRYQNQVRQQDINLTIKHQDMQVQQCQEGYVARVKSHVEVQDVIFNLRRGSFVQQQTVQIEAKVIWNKDLQTFFALPGSFAEIDKEKYPFWLLFENQGDRRLSFSVQLKNANYNKVAGLMTPGINNVMQNFKLKKNLSAKLLLVTNPDKRQEPAFILDFEGKDQALTIGNSKIPYSHVNFRGRILSLDSTRSKGDVQNATVMIYPLNGYLYSFPFSGRIKVTNLSDPQIAFGGKLEIKAEDVDFKVARDFALKGKVIANISYTGPAAKLNTHEFLDKPMKLRARLLFKDLSYREFNRPFPYILNGVALLNNRDMQFDSLRLKTVAGNAVLKGKAFDFMAYLLGRSNGFKADVAARSELLDLNPIFAEKKSQELTKALTKTKVVPKSTEKTSQEKLNEGGLNHFEFNVQLFARKLLIRKVVCEYANADLFYKDNFLNIKTLAVNACEGKMIAHGALYDFTRLKADVILANVNVTKLFEQFENFGQKAIRSENLKGLLNCDAKLGTDLDKNFEVIPSTLTSDVRLRLRDGHLINFEPLQNLSNLVFRNRDFNDISFSEINENFHFEGYRMSIEELEVASSVFNFYVVDALYNFKGISNFNLLVPWSNLKKRNRNFIPRNSGESSGSAKGLKLNYRGPAGNMRISFGHQSSAGL